MQKLSSVAQKAILAHRIIQSIRSEPFPTNSQLVAMSTNELQQLNKNIKPMGERLLKKFATQPFLQKQNYEQVINIFRYGHGLPLSSNFLKTNANYGLSKYILNPLLQSLVFFPTSTTTKLFNYIYEQQGRCYIYGYSGIGKTISSLLLWHLSSLITDFRVKENVFVIEPFVDMKQFIKTPKIIYFNESQLNQAEFVDRMKQNCPQLDFLKREKLKTASDITKLISQEYCRRGIQTKVILDQCQKYFYTQQKQQQYQQQQQQQKQKQLSRQKEPLVQQLNKNFSNLVLLTNNPYSTQYQQIYKKNILKIQQKQEQQRLWQQSLFNTKCPFKELHSKYRLTQQYEQVQTTLMVWFQIMRGLVNKGIILTDTLISNLYEGFKPFNKYGNSWQTTRQNPWRNDNTHSKIQKKPQLDNYLQKKINLQWAKLQKFGGIYYYNYYSHSMICTLNRHTPYSNSTSIRKLFTCEKNEDQNLVLEAIIRIIYKLTRQYIKNDRQFLESNRYRLPKSQMPIQMVESPIFKKIVQDGVFNLEEDGEYYRINLSPLVIKKGIRQAVYHLSDKYDIKRDFL